MSVTNSASLTVRADGGLVGMDAKKAEAVFRTGGFKRWTQIAL